MRAILFVFGVSTLALVPGPAHAVAPEVAIAAEPIHSGYANVHPNLLLSLSVEFPTVGIAYRGDDGTYNRSREYIGYFNPTRCYVYEGGNRNLGDSAYFRILKKADPTTRECGGDSFSGNFMNWAASSAIDMLRYALTGGDRVIDTAVLTVLQRAVLHDAGTSNFYAHATHFPRRKLKGTGNSSAPAQVTPFKTDTLYIVSCRNRILFSDHSSGLVGNSAKGSVNGSRYCQAEFDGKGMPSPEAKDKALGEYLVRVRVCDDDEGPTRTDLCRKIGSHYKPVGELQRNADRVRVAAMGYLADDSARRYGGVLRAPMKYLGTTRIDPPRFLRAENDSAEWDPQTGVFYTDPEQAPGRMTGSANSGAINYLNKFGRNALYKTYDPLGELYYEGLRYLQGKQPTPEATSAIDTAMRDGFPVLERWNDPIIASCQRNYILTIADVNTHGDSYIPGNARSSYDANSNEFDAARAAEPAEAGKTPALDATVWTRKVGEMEADRDGSHANPAPQSGLAALHEAGTGGAGHGSYYMAGLAYWANTNDIRQDKPTRVETFAIDMDEGGNGLIDGSSRSIKPRASQLYLAAKYGGFDDKNGDGNPFITLDADGTSLVRGSNAEWDNGEGAPANYFLAGQPREMIAAVRRIFARIGASSGSLSGVALSSSKMDTDGIHVFQPGFDPSRWGGSVRKRTLRLSETGELNIAPGAHWDAGEILTGAAGRMARPAPEARRIYTSVDSAFGTKTVALRWDDLSDDQKTALDTSPADGTVDGLGPARLDYLRGARGLELGEQGGVFRRRDRILGDIVGSNPVHVGVPSSKVSDDGYAKFHERNMKRAAAVYVGANDGMLHGFDAGDGTELFAYVPSALIPALPQLTNPDYVHRAYVDGGLAAGEARVGGQWKTVLAGAMGGGAQGVFALDVTNPADFGRTTGALFEFTDADDADMGNVTGAPAIAKFRMGVKKGVPQYGYFLVVASGLNNYREDGAGRANDDAASALFLLSLDKPASAGWALGRNYYKFRLPASSTSIPNGLSQPALVIGADRGVRYVYAGDLQGNLWRLDFTADAPWKHASGLNRPLFVALDKDRKRQPITVQPSVVVGPGGFVVMFGTGKYVEHADAAADSFSAQSFYAVFDTGERRYSIGGRAELEERTAADAAGGGFRIQGAAFVYGSAGGGKKGWYLDFPGSKDSGERVVSQAAILNGNLFFNTLIPSGDPCAGGGGRSYALSALSGLPAVGQATGILSQVGMLSRPVVIETEVHVSRRNAVGNRTVKRRHRVVHVGTGGAKGTAWTPDQDHGETTLRAGRFSWREIPNWQELNHASSKK